MRKIIRFLRRKFLSFFYFWWDLFEFARGFGCLFQSAKRIGFPITSIWAHFNDKREQAGEVSDYFIQDLFMAKKIIIDAPNNHYDIGSRLDGFISHLLCAGIEVSMIDIRPLKHTVNGLSFVQGDATNLEQIPDNSISSISSLSAVEHFGLGRYGDPIDVYAADKAMREIQRVSKEGGKIYISVPISNKNQIDYNGCRLYKPQYIVDMFSDCNLIAFGLIKSGVIDVFEPDALRIIKENRFETGENACFVFEKNSIKNTY